MLLLNNKEYIREEEMFVLKWTGYKQYKWDNDRLKIC